MSETRAIHPSVQRLLEVQKYDRELRFLRDAMRLRPQELEEDRRKVEFARSLLATATHAIRECKLEIDRGELEVRRAESDIEKSTIALNSAKTNQEYSVMKAQIERHTESRGESESRVIEALTKLDQLESDRGKVASNLEHEERDFARKEAELGELIAGLEQQATGIEESRKSSAASIDADHLELYERILAHVKDAAIVQVRDGVCQGCFMQVTKQDRTTILIAEKLVTCRSCGRLLFL